MLGVFGPLGSFAGLLVGDAAASCDYSALYDDLVNPPPQKSGFVEILSNNGLFNTMVDMKSYINSRWKIVDDAGEQQTVTNGISVRVTPLVDSVDLIPFMVEVIQHDVLLRTLGNSVP